MIEFDKWHMPDGENHLPQWMQTVNRRIDGRLTYQYGKYEAALKYTKQTRLAIDIGAHIGLWTFYMARDFDHVAAFEPNPPHQECWYKNMDNIFNAQLFEMALGEAPGHVQMETRTIGSSGDTQIKPNAAGSVTMETLDSFDLQDVDFIKIDCEGYEDFILRGAMKTLMRCKPCVIVEQKPGHGIRYGLNQNSAVELLKELGAVERQVISGDYILSWD